MIPNSAVYGFESTWIHVLPNNSYNTDNKNMIPQWQTIAGGISANKVDYTKPLDNSICFCAIADDSPAAGAYFAAGDSLNSPVENKPFKEDFFISSGDYAYGVFTTIPYYDITDNFPRKYTYDTNSTPISNNPNMGLKPLCSVSPKDLVLCIYVVGYNSDYTDYKVSTYNGYKQQYSTSHPNITQIYAIPYCRDENSNTRHTMSNSESYNFNGFARMGLYELPNNNGSYYNYFANIDVDGGIIFNLWGIPTNNGTVVFYSSSPNYIYRAFGSGGTFTAANGNLYYSRPWGANYQEHSGDDWIRRVAASYGLFFVDRTDHAQTAAYASANMMLGTIDNNGLCHGDYTSGTDNTEQPQYTWLSTNESTYDPAKPIDPNHYTDTTPFSTGTIGNAFVKYYILSLSDLQQLNGKLFDYLDLHDPAVMDINTYLYKEFLSTNPLDTVIGLKKFPLNFSNILDFNELTGTTLKLGRYDTNISCRAFSTVTTKTYDFGSALIWRHFGDFRDFEPYTIIDLVVPFCGVKRLDLGLYMGHTLNLKMCVDVFTGYVTCYIFVDNICVDSLNGNCSIDLPISGIQTASLTQSLADQLQNQYISQTKYDYGIKNFGINLLTGASNSLLSFKGGASSLAGPIGLLAMGGLGASAKMNEINMQGDIDRASLAKQEFDLRHTIAPIASVGSISPVNSLCQPMQAYLIIHRCKMMNYDPEIYSKTIGYACLKNGKVKNFSGYTQASDICLDSVNCTAAEKAMIKRAFATGVYL